ncbi:phage holin family protein [Companilactobacillus nuruki]|uniref:Holin n=1 Tax=Companilactobacillus nuruki TaxID=1993540 RepID=A0A2N7ATY2_9LACO|nr:phage holin family protein [Companilactobacillus nuruki]PMD70244.1 holin [Companilactobacillus nuruki]
MYGVPQPHVGLVEWWIAASKLAENAWFITFITVILVDLATGFTKGFFKSSNTKVNSTIGREGLIKHTVIAGIATIFYPLVDCWGLASLANLFLMFFIGQYGISIVENLGAMGIPLPRWVTDSLEKLRDRGNEN